MNNKITPVAFLDYGYDSKGKLNETKVYSIHTDHLGTPKAITNKNQETVWQIDLDTFGETKSIQSKDNFQFNLRFAGQYFDQESGYHYNYHRYYDPKVGRYLTSDPIGLNGGSLNTYAYVDNEIWGLVDPSGLLSYNPYTRNFTIDKGDTLQSIGKEFGVSDVDLTKLNPQFFANPKDITKFKQDTFVAGAIIKAPYAKNINAFKIAVSLIGSTKYAHSVQNGRFKENTNKCNLFVYDVLTRAGFSAVPSRKAYGIFDMPATAESLAEGNFPNSRIVSIDEARIGDVMSWKVNYRDATGHTTIYTGKVNILWRDSNQDLTRKPHQYGTIGAGEHAVNYRRHDEEAMSNYPLDKAKIRRIDQ